MLGRLEDDAAIDHGAPSASRGLRARPPGGATPGGLLAAAQAAHLAHPGHPNAVAEAIRAALGISDEHPPAFAPPGAVPSVAPPTEARGVAGCEAPEHA